MSDKADELAKLWDNDAVRIQPGYPAEVGKALIVANDKHWEATKGKQKALCGHMEIQDVKTLFQNPAACRSSRKFDPAR